SNEASKLASASHQQALARSISAGVRQFFQQNPPPGTYIAWLRDSGKIAQGPRDHRVQPGDTLAMLAVRFQVSAATLRSANNLKTDELKVGQVLTIPGTELAAQ
ncbi:MAG: LysM peptidoglycan-binding domain-containing protein, partial [Pseudomonas sp.]